MRIVLHADDFGASSETVRATIDCIESGVLTSASIMPGMPATDEALAYASAHSGFDFGVHLTFVGDEDERPLSPPETIGALATPGGRFRPTRELRLGALVRRLPEEQIERELRAQLESVAAAGVVPSHVDSHRHMHKLPSFRRALERVLPEYGIAHVRAVQDIFLRRPWRSPTYWLGWGWQRKLARHFATTDHFYMPTGLAETGWEVTLCSRLDHLAGSSLEVGVHPGPDGWRAAERDGIASFAAAARSGGHDLVTWRDIARPGER